MDLPGFFFPDEFLRVLVNFEPSPSLMTLLIRVTTFANFVDVLQNHRNVFVLINDGFYNFARWFRIRLDGNLGTDFLFMRK